MKLRVLVPLLMTATALSAMAIGYRLSLTDSRDWLLDSARRDGLALVERLSRLAELEQAEHPAKVEADLLLSATDLRIDALLLTDPDLRVLAANRRAWRGQSLDAVWPAFGPPQIAAARQAHSPQIRHLADQQLMTVATSFALKGRAQEIRGQQRGLLLLVMDLSGVYRQAQLQALNRLAPMAGVSLAALALLMWVIRRHVSRPLAAIQSASEAFMAAPDQLHAAPEHGLEETARLGRSLNALQSSVRQSRAQLRESEAHFRMLADAGHLRVWGLTPEGTVDYANAGLRDAVGWPADGEVAPAQWQHLLAHDANATAAQLIAAAWQQQRGFSAELELETASGATQWLLCEGSPRHNDAGQWTGYWVQGLDITARKHEMTALAASEQRQASLINGAMDAIISTDAEQRIVLFNPAAERMFGCKAEEVLGRNLSIFLPEAVRGSHPKHLRRMMVDDARPESNALMGGRMLHALRTDGSSFPIEASVSHMRVGTQHLFTAIVRDVTERERARAELRSREGIFTAIADQAREAIVLVDADTGRFLEFNRAAHEELGYSAEEFGGMGLADVVPEGEGASRVARLKTLVEGRPAVLEEQHRRKDGSLRDVRISAQSVLVQGQRRLAAIWSDITEAKAQARELDAFRTRLQALVEERTAELHSATAALQSIHDEQIALFDAAPVGIALITDQRLVRCNPRLETLLRAAAGSLTGRRVESVLPLEALRIAGERSSQDHHVARQDGSLFWARLTAQRLELPAPSTGALLILEDIDQEHAAAQALQEAKDLAESAARMKSDFLANMSHEIRTPLNAVLGMAHLSLRTELSAKQRGYLNNIQSAGQHLLTLLNDLLDLSKIEAGKLELEHAPFSLDKVLGNLRTLIAPAAAAKGLELVFDVGADVPREVVGDGLRLGQILINYTSNAVKFTQSGEVTVAVRQLDLREGHTHLRFEVQDTGIGLSADQRRQLFIAFQQADPSTTRKFGGTGLGLSIAKRLAGLMGGQVGVESQLGQGSTFWVDLWLPLAADAASPHPTQLQGLNVWLVDDSPHASASLQSTLSPWGVRVRPFGSAAEVLAEASRSLPPDWVFVDHQLPDASGGELIRALQTLIAQPAPRWVLLTEPHVGSRSQEPPPQCHELAKPPTASDLLDLLMGGLETPAAVDHTPQDRWAAGRRILLVEDNAINRQVAQELLEETGALVVEAENGEVALRRLEQEPAFDLVFMDMQMPVLDGVEATRRLRNDPRWPTLPVVAMTANALAQDRDLCLSAGMNDFLSKPIEPDSLYALLHRWLPNAPSAELPVGPTIDPVSAADAHGLPVLDTAKGLRACLGKTAMYQRLLGQFVQQYANEPSLIETDWAASRQAEAERRAHTLKGVSAQLGALPLSQAASDLEKALHAQRGQPAPQWPAPVHAAFAAQMRKVQAAIAQHLAESPPPPAAEVGPAAWASALDGLTARLERGDPEAAEWLQTHEPALRLALGTRFASVSRAIENFDFEQALQLCQGETAS
ncbi:PAS domain S-box protein [Inhella gelatinilytica]|uniref:Sensory/regulatory protein RpfC n=1 Tax=Inhella gelatinilytica TaxID=2795030 RepID=A0A931IXB7_9BURK|nr:PAS domain S-box protein [Inhella gelatinilytica]MBH9553617.1 PAS domain S-box protein [Inhella gelatinilytica]